MRDTVASALTQEALWREAQPLRLEELFSRTDASIRPDQQPTSSDIVLFPVAHWWEIPALIHYYPAYPGPEPAVHACLFKRWAERFGAELVKLGPRDVTIHATRPPQERTAAILLAWEHTQYCQDIPILDTLEHATEIYRGTVWSFWWD